MIRLQASWAIIIDDMISGDGDLPENCGTFMLLFGLIFAAVASTKVIAVQRGHPIAKWIPSGVAFAIGFLNTPSFSIARLIGGLIEYLGRRRMASGAMNIRLIVIASGFVLGEGVIGSVVLLLLRLYGVEAISCWGCSGGICPCCPD